MYVGRLMRISAVEGRRYMLILLLPDILHRDVRKKEERNDKPTPGEFSSTLYTRDSDRKSSESGRWLEFARSAARSAGLHGGLAMAQPLRIYQRQGADRSISYAQVEP